MCVAFGTTGTTGTYQGPRTLTLDEISAQIDALDAQLLEQGFEAGTDAYIAAQEQARAEFVKFITEHPALNFSEEDFATAVGAVEGSAFTPAQAIAQYYNYDFTDKELFNLPYGDTITTTVTSYNASPQGQAAIRSAGSVFDTDTQAALAGGSWVPQAVTRAGVQSPTDYELMTGAQLAPYLPTAPYDVTKISQNTPAYTAAGLLPPNLFDPINFPQRAITRGTPVITKGFDAAGNPTTGITMGQSTAAPTGANIGQLNTAAQIPTTGMHVAGSGLGGTTVGTMPTTGNIVSTGADTVTQFVDENGVLQTSSISPTVINTGEEDTVLVTPTEVDLSQVPGSVAYCALYPDTAVCTPGSDEFCALAGNLNHASCKAADKCLDGEELWNGICVDICEPGFTRDADGICQRPQDLCPAGSDKAGQQVPAGQTQAWCSFPKCPDGTARAGVTIPVGAAADWCDIAEPPPKCPDGTDREGQTIPDNETTDWCTTGADETTITCYDETGQSPSQEVTGVDPSCPVGWTTTAPTVVDPYAAAKVACADAGGTWDDTTDPESCIAAAITTCPAGTVRETETIPDGQTVAWCDIAAVATCDLGTDKAGMAIPANQDSSWCNCGVGYTWNAETKECDLADPVDPYAVDKAACAAKGASWAWNDSTNECDEVTAVDPYAAEKAACANTGGTWDDTTEPESCIPATVVATCPAGATNNAGQPIPDGQTLDSFCCPEGMAWNASSNQCETSGTAVTNVCAAGTLRAGASVPAGEPATWCDLDCPAGEAWDTEALACATVVDPSIQAACETSGGTWTDGACVCPQKSTLINGQCMADAIGPGVPSYCPQGSAKEGQQIPTGETEAWCATVVDPWAADKADCDNAGGTWNNTTNSCDAAAAAVDPYAAEKAVCDNTVGGATWDDVNNICVPAAIGDRFAKEKAACAAIGSSHRWDEGYMACVPVGDLTGLVDSELLDQTYAYQTALSTDPVGTYADPYSMGPDIGVVAAKTPGAPAIPTNLGTSLVPGINSINFGDGQLANAGGFGYAANTAAGEGGGGFGFAHGGEVEDRLGQRQNASDSRLMRHAGLGQFADQIGDEMLSTIARIMDRKD